MFRWDCMFTFRFVFSDVISAITDLLLIRLPKTIDSYLDALINEIRIYSESPRLAGRRLAFAYFGGGTPSMLSAGQLQRSISRNPIGVSLDRHARGDV